MQATKEVVIGNSRFQISRVDAETGSFLLYQVLASLRKVMQEEGGEDAPQPQLELTVEEKTKQVEEATMAMIENMLMNLDRAMFGKIQRDALSVCGQFTAVGETETILPVLMASGKIAIPALKTDFQVLTTLTRQSLHFNLLPFFFKRRIQDSDNLGGFESTPFPTLDNYLYRPVALGFWKQHEATDGTYSFYDLVAAHEILDIQELNRVRHREWIGER